MLLFLKKQQRNSLYKCIYPYFHIWNMGNLHVCMKYVPIFPYMNYRNSTFINMPYFHTWNIGNSTCMYEITPIFSYMKYRKFLLHVWNGPLYFHTWNTGNSTFMYEICPLHFHRWNRKFYCYIDGSLPHISIYEIEKSIFHIWNMHLYYHTWNIENSILVYEICTWLGLLFHPWRLGSLGFHGCTV